MKKSWDATAYAANSKIQLEGAATLLDKSKFNPTDIVLDLGCGDGSLTNAIAAWVPQGKITGLDLSEAMITHATATYPNIQFIQHDMDKLSDLTGSFDVITAVNCIHWIFDKNTLFKNIKKLLNPNGKFYALSYPRTEPFWTSIDNLIAKARWQPYFKNYEHNYYHKELTFYQEALLANNFSKQQVREHRTTTIFKNSIILENNIAAWLPHLEQIPTAQQADFLNDFSTEFIKLSKIEADGTIHYPYATINISATA